MPIRQHDDFDGVECEDCGPLSDLRREERPHRGPDGSGTKMVIVCRNCGRVVDG